MTKSAKLSTSLRIGRLRYLIDESLQFDFAQGCFVRKITCGVGVAGARAGYIRKGGYSEIRLNRIRYFEHNLVWVYFKGEFPPEGYEIDHRDRIRSNNHPDNLRLGTRSFNNANVGLRRDNKVGYRGVHFSKEKNKFCAQVSKDQKVTSLGYFATAEEAAKAAAEVRDRLFGEFAYHPNM